MRRLIAPTLATMALLAFAPSALASAPVIERTVVSEVTTTSATLEADVNLGGQTVLYRFEYGPSDCSANSCATVPGGEGEVKPDELPSGIEVARIKAPLSGLEPATTYHFRVVATNGPQTANGADRTLMTRPPQQIFGPCPNDNFRLNNPAAARIEHSSANLPDCRSYEQATPVDKNAGDVTGIVPLARAALHGGGISFISTTGVPGGVGSQEFPAYLATRGTDSWSTKGLLPPGDEGQNAMVLGWTPDFSEIFSKATLIGNPPLAEFLMTPAGGAPIQIADYAPEMRPTFAGASEGAAEVLFESKVAVPGVDGAIEGKSNVYLWDRAKEALHLAGILNDEEAPSKGAFAGSYDWIQGVTPQGLSEGGSDRSYYTQEQHAISTDGSAIYFTAAGTGQLYLRENPTAKQSAVDLDGKCTEPELACTIRVSASQKTDGIIPSGEDPGGPRPAAFMGASADGSVSLFTSSEKLTNDANTGPEQEPAAIERADLEGKNVLPAFQLTHASDVEVDATYVYWINSETGAIERVKLSGGSAEEIIAPTDTDNPRGIAVGGEFIYWANASGEEGEGTIGRAKLGVGGASEVEANFVEEAGNPHDVAAEGEYLYWTNSALADSTSTKASIGRAKKVDGGETEAEFLVIDDFERKTVEGITTDASHIYWVVKNNQGESRIRRIDIDGNPASTRNNFVFLGPGVEAKDVAVDATHIFWSTQTDSLIGRAKLVGSEQDASEVEPEWIKDASHPQGIAVDASNVYWSSNGETVPNPGNDLYRYEAETRVLSDISVDSGAFAGAEVQGVLGSSGDGDYVYYAANGVPDGVTNSPNGRGESAVEGGCKGSFKFLSGVCNLYLWHAGVNDFIARLDTGGNELETDATNWVAKTSAYEIFPSTNFEKTARVSPDGHTLLFRSQRQLSGYDNEGVAQFYRYRAGDPGPVCVSCNPTGAAPTGQGPGFGDVFPAVVVPTNPASGLAHNLSSDGNRVFFETTDALVEADTNGNGGCSFTGSDLQSYFSCLDVYEWEAQGSGSCDAAHAVAQGGCLYLLSTGKGKEPALIADASADGKDAYFYTRSKLVGQDQDQLLDVYDARIEGGLAAQNQPSPPICESVDGCHGAPVIQPEIPAAPKFSGPGNPKTKSPPCKKPKHKVKGRCVAKHHKAKKHHKGAKGKANTKRRAAR